MGAVAAGRPQQANMSQTGSWDFPAAALQRDGPIQIVWPRLEVECRCQLSVGHPNMPPWL
jgi:hypothetical protein